VERTILVTGGAGYIGSHFIKTYMERRQSDNLVVIDDLTSGHQESLPKSDRVTLVKAKLADKSALEKLFLENKITAVVHFAGKICVGESQIDPFLYFKNNVLDSTTLFEVMETHGVRRIVFSSSAAVYGQPEYSPLDESHPFAPTSVYGTTKLIAEQILQSLTDSSLWSSVSLRYFNAAGAAEGAALGESHNPETHLIPNLLMAALGQNEGMTIHGSDYPTKDGTCVRDYIHVNDLAIAHCQALDLLMDSKTPFAHGINLGTSVGATVLEILALVEELSQVTIAKRFGNRRPGDPAYLVANADKAEKLLGWRPQYDLRKTIATAWLWHKNRLY
jgi:UDP-glucose 4-epimerase